MKSVYKIGGIPGIVDFKKNETSVSTQVREARQSSAGFTFVELRFFIGVSQRDSQQRAIGFERPGIVGAAKVLVGVTAGCADQARALLCATVHHGFDGTVRLPYDQQRATAYVTADPFPGVGDLTFMPCIIPGVDEKVCLFELENFLIDVQITVYPVGLHQRPYRIRIVQVSGHG